MADWFYSWVKIHCQATGASEDTGETLVTNRRIVEDFWQATEGEMTECTNRLISFGRTPKFPNEHMDALGRELRDLRSIAISKADEAYARQWEDPATRPQCEACDGTGIVVVPHPRCVWHGTIVNHPGNGVFYTVGVLCDVCAIGKELIRREDDRVSRASDTDLRKRPRQATFSQYTRGIFGHDGITLLRQHEKQMAELGRAGGDRYSTTFRDLVARVAGGTKPSLEHVAKNREFANDHVA